MLTELINGYTLYMKENSSASSNTMNSYIGDINGYGEYIASKGYNDISKTNKTLILTYLMELQKQEKATATIARNISSLRSFYQYLLNRGIIKEDPTLNLKTPKIEKKVPEVLTEEEVNIILEQPDLTSFKGMRDRVMLEILYSTGLGINELIALNIEDINLSMEIIEIKSEPTRVVPIGSIALEYLTMYLDKYKDMLDSKALFINRRRDRITRQGFWKNLKEYEKKSGIEKNVTPQILRQSFAVHMIDNGADIKTVQKILGHSDISTTQIYAIKSANNNIREVYKKSHPRA